MFDVLYLWVFTLYVWCFLYITFYVICLLFYMFPYCQYLNPSDFSRTWIFFTSWYLIYSNGNSERNSQIMFCFYGHNLTNPPSIQSVGRGYFPVSARLVCLSANQTSLLTIALRIDFRSIFCVTFLLISSSRNKYIRTDKIK